MPIKFLMKARILATAIMYSSIQLYILNNVQSRMQAEIIIAVQLV